MWPNHYSTRTIDGNSLAEYGHDAAVCQNASSLVVFAYLPQVRHTRVKINKDNRTKTSPPQTLLQQNETTTKRMQTFQQPQATQRRTRNRLEWHLAEQASPKVSLLGPSRFLLSPSDPTRTIPRSIITCLSTKCHNLGISLPHR